jgi:hypothetical protein
LENGAIKPLIRPKGLGKKSGNREAGQSPFGEGGRCAKLNESVEKRVKVGKIVNF